MSKYKRTSNNVMGSKVKYCSHCKTTKGPFMIHARTRNKAYHWCRPCNLASAKAAYNRRKGTPEHNAYIARANKLYAERHPGYWKKYNKKKRS